MSARAQRRKAQALRVASGGDRRTTKPWRLKPDALEGLRAEFREGAVGGFFFPHDPQREAREAAERRKAEGAAFAAGAVVVAAPAFCPVCSLHDVPAGVPCHLCGGSGGR